MDIHDITTEEDIKHLVDSFYVKVLADPVIGYIFTDIVPVSWEHHMPVMYSFWSSIILGTNNYKSNPMTKHIQLNRLVPLTSGHFGRWLMLWEQNIIEHFNGENAKQAISRARNIASIMEYKVRQSN